MEGGGDGGRGVSQGGVGGWGERAYNCNWITIKIFLKERKPKGTHRYREQMSVAREEQVGG